jgi:hypothetical protein
MRRYLPKIGDLVKLKDGGFYFQLCREQKVDISLWAWFKVEKLLLAPEYSPEMVGMVHYDAGVEKERVIVDPHWIDPPFGWEPGYEIWARDKESAQKVVFDWFTRGINVWANHDLGSPSVGGKAFTPVSAVQHSPHWRYTGKPVELIEAKDCAAIFQVGWEEQKEDCEWSIPPSSERKARKAALDAIKADGWEIVRHGSAWCAYKRHILHRRTE